MLGASLYHPSNGWGSTSVHRGGDAKAQIKGYDKNNNYQYWDKRPIFRAMAEGIVQGVTEQQPAWHQASRAWNQIFMTYHQDGDAPDNSSKWFHEDAWLTANGIEVWKEVDQVYPTMLSEYQLNNPIKPSLFLGDPMNLDLMVMNVAG